jgi:hypothetical protein
VDSGIGAGVVVHGAAYTGVAEKSLQGFGAAGLLEERVCDQQDGFIIQLPEHGNQVLKAVQKLGVAVGEQGHGQTKGLLIYSAIAALKYVHRKVSFQKIEILFGLYTKVVDLSTRKRA